MHDAHAKPPDSMRNLFKDWRKRPLASIDAASDVIDPKQPSWDQITALPASFIPGKEVVQRLEHDFVGATPIHGLPHPSETLSSTPFAFEVKALPGMPDVSRVLVGGV